MSSCGRLILLTAFLLQTLSVGCLGPIISKRKGGLYHASIRQWSLSLPNGMRTDLAEAVPPYLSKEGLIPPECHNGIIVIRGGYTEGGWAWVEFRCNEIDLEKPKPQYGQP